MVIYITCGVVQNRNLHSFLVTCCFGDAIICCWASDIPLRKIFHNRHVVLFGSDIHSAQRITRNNVSQNRMLTFECTSKAATP